LEIAGASAIKALKKASQQLQSSARESQNLDGLYVTLVNDGCEMLTHDDILEVTRRYLRNNTKTVTGVIVLGHYLANADSWNSAYFARCDYVGRADNNEPSWFGRIRDGWDMHTTRLITKGMMTEEHDRADKFPIHDLGFEVDGISYRISARL
ncbi:MAG: hypothetical protein LH610_05440, partial [Sphingomonas bacterium]|nr:hypothetical protein [Sphingomonas bacterium]